MRTPIKMFVESGFERPPKLFFTEKEYPRVLQGTIGVCVDIIAIDRSEKVFYLAMRKQRPMAGWWWFGGRHNPGETPTEAAIRVLEREVGLTLAPERLEKVSLVHHMCKDREQEPQDMGCHMSAITFVVEFSPDEVEHIAKNLEGQEYEEFGLRAFTREELVAEGARETVIALYDEVFSETNEILRRLAAEDGISIDNLIAELAKEEDRRRHVRNEPFEGEMRRRCVRNTCVEENESLVDDCSLGN